MKIQVQFDHDLEYASPIKMASEIIGFLNESPFYREDVDEILEYLSVYVKHHPKGETK